MNSNSRFTYNNSYCRTTDWWRKNTNDLSFVGFSPLNSGPRSLSALARGNKRIPILAKSGRKKPKSENPHIKNNFWLFSQQKPKYLSFDKIPGRCQTPMHTIISGPLPDFKGSSANINTWGQQMVGLPGIPRQCLREVHPSLHIFSSFHLKI